MSIVANYGGWFTDQQESTGSSLSNNISHRAKAVPIIMATVLFVGTGGAIPLQAWQSQRSSNKATMATKIPNTELSQIRSPAEDLARIREIFNPAMSDLAKAFGVSRQAIYNWVRAEQHPKPEHIAKLRDFAQAADAIAESGISVNSALLKRKLINGKNLFEIGQSEGAIRDAVQLLIQIVSHESEQRNRMAKRFSGRRKDSRSLESDFPEENDLV